MGVLPDEEDAIGVVEGHDRDGARVLDVVPHDRPGRQVNNVATDIPDPALEDDLSLPDGSWIVLIRQRHAVASAGVMTST